MKGSSCEGSLRRPAPAALRLLPPLFLQRGLWPISKITYRQNLQWWTLSGAVSRERTDARRRKLAGRSYSFCKHPPHCACILTLRKPFVFLQDLRTYAVWELRSDGSQGMTLVAWSPVAARNNPAKRGLTVSPLASGGTVPKPLCARNKDCESWGPLAVGLDGER